MDEFANQVLGQETKMALYDVWNSVKNEIQSIAAYLSIGGEQPQPESK